METKRDPLDDLMEPTQVTSNNPTISVSDLSRSIKRTLEGDFAHVRVRGEISGAKRATSGHWYFRLKDEKAVIDAVMWRGQAGKSPTQPEDGLEVIATGRITTYEGRSVYQIVVEALEPAGVGALLKILEDRRKKLADEGLFSPDRKKVLPFLPDVIGIVTSPTGAVIRDILHRVRDRFPRRIIVWPVRVQGEGAAEEIVTAIQGFNSITHGQSVPRPDVLIVARGGGSLEDLWAFNEEAVVRAAASSSIPLISAIGHETDTTLIDYAADKRAPTPTAAAELAVPVRTDLMANSGRLSIRLDDGIARGLSHRSEKILGLARGLSDPARLLDTVSQRLDDWTERLKFTLLSGLNRRQDHITALAAGLPKPQRQLDAKQELLEARSQALQQALASAIKTKIHNFDRVDPVRRLVGAITRKLDDGQVQLDKLAGLLESYSPENTLARGFVLVRDGSEVITSPSAATPGRKVELQFAGGQRRRATIDGQVKSKQATESSPQRETQGKLL